MKPSQLAKSGSEHGEQAAVFAWAAVASRYGVSLANQWAFDDLDLKTVDYNHGMNFIPLQWMHAIPNGGSRGDTAQSRRIQGGMMKAEGVRPGVSDIFLPLPTLVHYPDSSAVSHYAGLYIEMKAGDGKLSTEQKAFIEYATSVGYKCVVCWTWQDAVKEICKYIRGL